MKNGKNRLQILINSMQFILLINRHLYLKNFISSRNEMMTNLCLQFYILMREQQY